jgi:hypothetical protein
MKRQLYAAVRRGDQTQPFMKQFIALGKQGQAHAKKQPLSP